MNGQGMGNNGVCDEDCEDSEMASMLDGVTDIQELIDNTIYKFKLK